MKDITEDLPALCEAIRNRSELEISWKNMPWSRTVVPLLLGMAGGERALVYQHIRGDTNLGWYTDLAVGTVQIARLEGSVVISAPKVEARYQGEISPIPAIHLAQIAKVIC